MDKPTTLLGALFALVGAANLFATGGACPYCYAELAGGTAIAGYGLIRKPSECKLQKNTENKKEKSEKNAEETNKEKNAEEKTIEKENTQKTTEEKTIEKENMQAKTEKTV